MAILLCGHGVGNSGPLVVPNAVHDVRGHPPSTAEGAATSSAGSGQLDTTSPFGAYTSPTYSKRSPVLVQFPHPLMKRKKGWNKKIIVVSLKKRSGKGSTKGNPKVQYEICSNTNIRILGVSSSTVRQVTELVKRQIGLDVVLLNSKSYPLLDNDSTRGEAFWKSTRKVLAANRGLYNKLIGQHTDLEKASIDLTCEDTAEESDSLETTNPESLEPLRKQPRLKYDISVNTKLDKIAKGVENIQKLIQFMQNMQQAFQCVVCRDMVSSPIVANCCGRILDVSSALMVGLRIMLRAHTVRQWLPTTLCFMGLMMF